MLKIQSVVLRFRRDIVKRKYAYTWFAFFSSTLLSPGISRDIVLPPLPFYFRLRHFTDGIITYNSSSASSFLQFVSQFLVASFPLSRERKQRKQNWSFKEKIQ
jgi:hypothetical protein